MKLKLSILFLTIFLFSNLSLHSQSSYVYQEEFGSQSNWTSGNNDIRELYTSNGKYYFEHKKTAGSRDVTTSTFTLDFSKDFEIETSILKISGEQDYGISFLYDYKDSDNYSEFGYTATGYYRVAETKSSSYSTIKSWTKSSYLKTGNYATNKLKIKKKGNRITYYVNGSYVYGMDFKKFKGSKMAFRLYRNQKVAVDYFRVKYIGGSTTNTTTASKTILFEGFNNKNNPWTEINSSDNYASIQNGDYIIERKISSGGYAPTISKYIDTKRDFSITAQIKKVSGVNNNGFGIVFGRKDTDNQNQFFISSDGSYIINKTVNGKRTYTKNWTQSSYIKTGNGAYNYLKVQKVGSKYEFYINSNLVYTTYSTKFYGDRVGFIVYDKIKMSVGYLSINYKDDKKTTITTNPKKTTNTTNTTGSKTILFEGFNNNNNTWSETNTSDVKLDIQNGDYIINHKRESGGWSTTIDKYINTSRDFRITAQIKKVSGIQNNGYGITFGKKDNNNLNHFIITGDGSYKIIQYKNGTRTYIKNWTKSSHIKTGNGVYNYLKVQKVGSAYKFFINSNLVHTSYSIKLYGDSVGFTLYDKQEINIGYLSMAYEDSTTTKVTKTDTNSHVIKETIIFDGYTDNKNDWSTTKNENVNFEIKNGNYYIDHKRAKRGWSSTMKKYIDTSRDFKILADIKKESGIQNNGYGIVFGRLDSNNQNLFFINGNGSYSINKMKSGKDNFLKEWASSSAIKKGNGAYNVLKIVKIGSKLEYYINNTKVYTDYSPEFFGDRFGYIVYDRQKISIAYLSAGYLDKKKTNTYTNTTITDNISNFNYNNSGFHFSEQFIDNSNEWFEGSDDKKDFKVKNGKYYLKHKRTEKGWATYDDHYIDTSKDFEIETKLDKISGVSNYGYGLIFGKKGDNDYRFYISSSGYYKVARMLNDKEQVIQKWTSTTYVNTGNLKSNILKIKKEDGKYKFYINDNYIYQTEFESFYGNELGFVVYNNQEVAVDYLRVKYIGATNTVVTNNKALRLPLIESFTNNTNGWSNESLDNYSVGINSGKLDIHRKKEGGIFISKHIDIDTYKDFIIETSISRQKAGASGLYGITFGRENASNEFTFLISTNGSYMFRKFDNDKYNKIIPFTSDNIIKTAIGQANKIKIVKSGKLLRFYINGKYMNEAPFENFFGNKLGFTAYHEQKIAVDYLNIKYQTNTYNDPPVVVISEPNVDLTRGFKIVKTKKIQVKGKVTDKDGIYEVLVNGVDAMVYEDGTFVANVPLKIGSNELVVKATDIKQASSTKRFNIKRKSPDIDITKPDLIVKKEDKLLNIGFGKYYALIIGVSEYNDASNVPDLEGLPTKDAKDLSDILVNKYNFDEENVVLLNNSPTENQILREFVKLKQKVTKKDNVLIFYAGHGIYDESTETGSWLPSDADPEYGLNMISNSTIKDYIKGINSKHTLLISDACFSGSIFKTRTYKTAPKSITRKFELPSRKAITSGTLKTVPNKSVFLKYLIDRLTNNQDLYLTARSIFDKIEEPVMNNSKNVPQYGTIQEVGDEGGDFIFVRKD